MNNKPAFLVEGDLEQKFIQNACPGAPVRKINCNGDSVCIESIAKRVGSLARLLHKRFSPIVVIFDRENREISARDLKRKFIEALKTECIDSKVIVGIPDRDIENWILADYSVFSSAAGIESVLIPPSFEGKKGKSIIKKSLGNEKSYVETVDGVAWLKSCRANVIRENSASFSEFMDELIGLQCRWLDQKQI